MCIYRHKVQYYETDKMGIAHHSNYVRWMEEARVYYLEQIGCGYDKLESEGIISPVLSVNCNYRKSTTFAEVIIIIAKIKEFKGIKLVIEYEMKNEATNETVCTAVSEHCFVDENFKIISLRKKNPECYRILTEESLKT